MRAGSLRNEVRIQSKGSTQDAFGGIVDGWADITDPYTWAQLIPLKGEEKYISEHLNTEVNTKIRIRYRDDIDNKMRVLYGARVYEIDSVIDPYERHREIDLMCTEVFDV